MFEPLEKGNLDHREILGQLEALIEMADPNPYGRIASLANASALLAYYLERINWVGFYLVDSSGDRSSLVLGPFQGAPACVEIGIGKGVCGTAWKEKKTMSVPDVTLFPGHIACDAASRSEVVVPLLKGEVVMGVLDVDSPLPNRFSTDDVEFFEQAASIIARIFP
jgi:GAF domain-containing protein